ncbi:MAG: photosynthetic reaction center cytochrome c subunit [Gemmatimonadaceae bacterium]|nr:photosynthetic reaction center cytochrome c subunit [Gemmatimonadaceae bacterium]
MRTLTALALAAAATATPGYASPAAAGTAPRSVPTMSYALQGQGGARGGGGQGAPQSTPEQRAARRDSIAAVRAATVQEVMAQIAGRENQPASDVFRNVQAWKTIPAGEFLKNMDEVVGRGLGRGCNDCHVANDWASDTLPRKQTARTMMGIVSDINTTLLPRLGPGPGGRPRAIQCITCHRGGMASRNAIIP